MGGTCTGEHGIGVGKKRYLEQVRSSLSPHPLHHCHLTRPPPLHCFYCAVLQEMGSGSMALMRRIKDALDPDGILNPDKVLDAPPLPLPLPLPLPHTGTGTGTGADRR